MHEEAVMFPHKWSTSWLCSAMFENVTRSLLHAWFTSFGNSQGVVEGQNFKHTTQNGAWTTNSFTPQSNTPIMKASELLFHKATAHLRKKLQEILTLRVLIVVRALFYHNWIKIEVRKQRTMNWTERSLSRLTAILINRYTPIMQLWMKSFKPTSMYPKFQNINYVKGIKPKSLQIQSSLLAPRC